jgi:nitrate reductase NapD
MRVLTRRDILTAHTPDRHHVSSAVVLSRPERREDVTARLSGMSGVEVHASQDSRIIITIEGATSGALGETLTTIALMDGVLAANMVFEHADVQEARG